MFPADTPSEKTAELDAVVAQLAQHGGDMAAVRGVFEEHWRTWLGDADWAYLRGAGVNAVRVPIGYWDVGNGAYTDGTDFGAYREVYANAWSILKSCVIEKAAEYGMGVLVDLHAVPGGANSADHSGLSTAAGQLWESNKCQVRTFEAAEFMARELKAYDNVVALQIINEAPFVDNWEEQQSFYLKTVNKIRAIDDDQPIVVSDGWDLGSWSAWSKECSERVCREQGLAEGTRTLGIVLDEHVYRTFSDEHRATPSRKLVDAIGDALPHDPFEVDVQVGEFSCVMDGNSWRLNEEQGLGNREEIVREFGQRQCALFKEKSAGFYFWTYKFQEGSGGEWGFREMEQKGCLGYGDGFREHDEGYYGSELESRLGSALNGHRGYWESQDGGRDWEHWRFEEGYRTAWADAAAFDRMGHSTIGRKAAWLASRLRWHLEERPGSGMEWVYKEGFKQGLSGFAEARGG